MNFILIASILILSSLGLHTVFGYISDVKIRISTLEAKVENLENKTGTKN